MAVRIDFGTPVHLSAIQRTFSNLRIGESATVDYSRYKTRFCVFIAQVRMRTGRNYSFEHLSDGKVAVTYEGPMNLWPPAKSTRYKALLKKCSTPEEEAELISLKETLRQLK